MDLQLRGKTALITGSTAGIGAGIAEALAQEGAKVIVHGRDRGRGECVRDRIRGAGGAAELVLGDVGDDDAAADVFHQACAAAGPIDILINNMGVYHPRTWDNAEPADWLTNYETNVVSAVRLIRLVMPEMKTRGWGRIVNNGSAEAMQPPAQMPDYAATKAALNNLTVSLAKHLAGTGITANTISPGIVATPALKAFFASAAREQGWADPDDWSAVERHVVAEWADNTVGRLATVDEVAAFFAYVASPLAAFINGSILRIDGGFVSGVA